MDAGGVIPVSHDIAPVKKSAREGRPEDRGGKHAAHHTLVMHKPLRDRQAQQQQQYIRVPLDDTP